MDGKAVPALLYLLRNGGHALGPGRDREGKGIGLKRIAAAVFCTRLAVTLSTRLCVLNSHTQVAHVLRELARAQRDGEQAVAVKEEYHSRLLRLRSQNSQIIQVMENAPRLVSFAHAP